MVIMKRAQSELGKEDNFSQFSQVNTDENKQLYTEYKNLFTGEEKSHSAMGIWTGTDGGIAVALKMFKQELLVELNKMSEQEKKNTARVALLHDDRIKSSEGNYLSITTKPDLERIRTWVPQTWYGKVCWRIIYFWYLMKYYSRIIIHLPIFDM
jgi:hypothetical protein